MIDQQNTAEHLARTEFERLAECLKVEPDEIIVKLRAVVEGTHLSRDADEAPDEERVREAWTIHEAFDPEVAWDECWFWTWKLSAEVAIEWIKLGWRWPEAAECARYNVESPKSAADILAARNISIELVEEWAVYAKDIPFPWKWDVWAAGGKAALDAFVLWREESEKEIEGRLATRNSRSSR